MQMTSNAGYKHTLVRYKLTQAGDVYVTRNKTAEGISGTRSVETPGGMNIAESGSVTGACSDGVKSAQPLANHYTDQPKAGVGMASSMNEW